MSQSTAVQALSEIKGASPALTDFRIGLDTFRNQFSGALVGTGISVDAFIEVATTAVLANPTLLDCEPASLIRSFRQAAALGLRPDNIEAAVIPYRGKAELRPMFQGITRSMTRNGSAKKVEARVVHHGDRFEYEYGLDPVLKHVPGPTLDQGGITHAYAIVWLTNGERQFEVMTREELEAIKRIAREQNNGKLGPAWDNYEGEMFRKIVVKRLAKYIDLDPRARAALRLDDAMAMGEQYEPADDIPEAEWRSLDQRATEHATRQTDDLKARLAEQKEEAPEAESDPEPDDEDPLAILDEKVGFGRHADLTWRELMIQNRGYVVHWFLVPGKLDGYEKQKARISAALEVAGWDLLVEAAKQKAMEAVEAGKLEFDESVVMEDLIDAHDEEGLSAFISTLVKKLKA